MFLFADDALCRWVGFARRTSFLRRGQAAYLRVTQRGQAGNSTSELGERREAGEEEEEEEEEEQRKIQSSSIQLSCPI